MVEVVVGLDVVVGLEDEPPQPANPRAARARTTRDQVRRRVMSESSFDLVRSWDAEPTVPGHPAGQTVAAPNTAGCAPGPSLDHTPFGRRMGPHAPRHISARVTDQLRSSLADLDPECLSGPDASRLLDAFAEVERLAAAGKLLAARRVESSNVWRRTGHRSAAAHVAEATGTGLGPAITALETARHLGLPSRNG